MRQLGRLYILYGLELVVDGKGTLWHLLQRNVDLCPTLFCCLSDDSIAGSVVWPSFAAFLSFCPG